MGSTLRRLCQWRTNKMHHPPSVRPCRYVWNLVHVKWCSRLGTWAKKSFVDSQLWYGYTGLSAWLKKDMTEIYVRLVLVFPSAVKLWNRHQSWLGNSGHWSPHVLKGPPSTLILEYIYNIPKQNSLYFVYSISISAHPSPVDSQNIQSSLVHFMWTYRLCGWLVKTIL